MFNVELVIQANKAIGEAGVVIDKGKLESAFSSTVYYESDLERLASIIRSIMQNHPFENGNKRTGVALLAAGCADLDIELTKSDDAWVHFAVTMVVNRWTVHEIVEWVNST